MLPRKVSRKSVVAKLLVEGARAQLNIPTTYDSAYQTIGYPNGDVSSNRGVCTDVIVRAYRHAGIDLQKLIHQDISAHWERYPRYPGNPKPDTNIDHRRVPNQAAFSRRHGASQPLSTLAAAAWRPGDIVDWKLPNGKDHTGLLTDRRDRLGLPFVIHNIGNGPMEEDVLKSWKIIAHFRYPK